MISKQKVRVLVVDDSAFIRRALISIFNGHPDIQIVDVAADGEMALQLVHRHRPDVVTLDIRMPVLDGLSALERIMKECPTPVVMLSSLTEKGGENTLRALELGAVDFIDKTSAGGPMEIAGIARELSSKIMVAAGVDVTKLHPLSTAEPQFRNQDSTPLERETELVLIGTSTGGPPALQSIVEKIPTDFPCPILIVQHMPVGFTASLAERLNRHGSIRVKEAQEGERIEPGVGYVAPAGKHLKVKRCSGDLYVLLDQSPEHTAHRPSVDVLFESAASVCRHRVLAFVLTGMGRDGAIGAAAIKKAGGRVVVESEKTSIVFGMPKAVMDSVTVDAELPLHAIPDAIMRLI